MKVYVHSDDPLVTMVIIWQDGKIGTVEDLLRIFLNNMSKRELKMSDSDPKHLKVKDCRGQDIELSTSVLESIRHMDDLFVVKRNNKPIYKSDTLQESSAGTVKHHLKEGMLAECDETEALLNAATIHVRDQRYRWAIELYRDIIKKNSHHLKALKGLAICYLKAGRPRDAFINVKTVLSVDSNNVEFLLLAGKCCVEMKHGVRAVDYLMKHCKLIHKAGEASRKEKQDVQVLLAKAYVLQDQMDLAKTVLQEVLIEDMEHPEALVEYATLLYPLGPEQAEKTMTILLQAVARNQSDKNNNEKFANVFTRTNGMELMRTVAPGVFKDSNALFCLASCLKDCSVIDGALKLQNEALLLEPYNFGIALACLHSLEILDNKTELIQFIKSSLKACPKIGIGALTCSVLQPFFEIVNDRFEIEPNSVIPETPIVAEALNREYTEDEKQWLAFLFTCVKIVFTKGLLSILPPVIRLIGPLCKGKELHKSIIGNEAAYFTCIDETMATCKELPSSVTDASKKIYFIGDSHCVPAAWQSITVQDVDYTIHPILSTGTKIWHLRPESTYYTKLNFNSAIENIPDGSLVTVCLGEIDCREQLLVCFKKARYDTIEDAMDTLVTIYLDKLKSLVDKHKWKVFIHPVLPVSDPFRGIVMQFNRILATRLLKETSLHWLNFVNDLLSSDGSTLKELYKLDGAHIHPSYLSLFAEALEKVVQV